MAGQMKRWWHVAWISGWLEGKAWLKIGGIVTPNLEPYDPVTNPNGWHPDRAVNHEFLELVMLELMKELRKSREVSERIERLMFNVHKVMKNQQEQEVQIAPLHYTSNP